MVERSLCMREVPGSIPGISTIFLHVLLIILKHITHFSLILCVYFVGPDTYMYMCMHIHCTF